MKNKRREEKVDIYTWFKESTNKRSAIGLKSLIFESLTTSFPCIRAIEIFLNSFFDRLLSASRSNRLKITRGGITVKESCDDTHIYIGRQRCLSGKCIGSTKILHSQLSRYRGSSTPKIFVPLPLDRKTQSVLAEHFQ